MKTCEICGKKVKDKRNKCCSWECRNKRLSLLYKGRTFTDEHKKNISKNHHDVSGSNNPKWRGGKRVIKGYIQVWSPNHPNKTKDGYVMEHRLAMEKKLNRYLKQDEVVHHKDKNKQNNSIDNLLLLPNKSEHTKLHAKDRPNAYKKVECDGCHIMFMKRNAQIKLTKRNFCSRNCFFKNGHYANTKTS